LDHKESDESGVESLEVKGLLQVGYHGQDEKPTNAEKARIKKTLVIGSVTVTKLRYFGHNCLTRKFISKQEEGNTKQSQHDQ